MHIQAEPRTLPRVAVLLATHMGRTYLDEQIDSILDQAGADLHIFVSDDGSTDGTLELLAERADADARITILPPETFGAPAPNFFRLLTTIPIAEYDYVGFADQDDVWMPAKLERHIRLLAEGRADGISSNVTAFSEDGTRILIKKDYPQRLVDHLFETPGPGSTFLLTQRFARLVAEQLDNPHSPRARPSPTTGSSTRSPAPPASAGSSTASRRSTTASTSPTPSAPTPASHRPGSASSSPRTGGTAGRCS